MPLSGRLRVVQVSIEFSVSWIIESVMAAVAFLFAVARQLFREGVVYAWGHFFKNSESQLLVESAMFC